jgi:Insertion element 4 transposase N-terminal/Transposase DDE domain
MPPAGQTKPTVVPRLSDRVAIGALTQTYPPGLVDQVLAQCGRRERRHRLLPARMVVYYLLAMCLFADIAYVEVLRLLVEALRRPGRVVGAAARLPVKSALIQARVRLGPEPLQVLFEQTARPVATQATQGAWYRRWRLMAIDGTCLDAADTPANQAWFGRPRSGRGEGVGAFPKVRVVGLAECGTHAIIGAAMGPYAKGETTLARGVLDTLDAGMLVLADRLFVGAALWRKAQATGAALLWRVTTGTKTAPALPVDRVLADGSWLSRLDPDQVVGAPIMVRVLEYTIDDPGRPQAAGQVYRLVTTILDPTQAPAAELAALYHQRWRWRACWMSSRPTSVARSRCCAPRPPRWCSRRSGHTCWSTMRSGC